MRLCGGSRDLTRMVTILDSDLAHLRAKVSTLVRDTSPWFHSHPKTDVRHQQQERDQPPERQTSKMTTERVPASCKLWSTKTPAELSVANELACNEANRAPIQLSSQSVQPRCYLCGTKTSQIHWFYFSHCPSCGDKAFEFRNKTANLVGMRALVTGGRVKLGYQVALKLLRAGCSVLITSRDPSDAEERYRQEPDYEEWGERLHVFDLALDTKEIENSIQPLLDKISQIWPDGALDILVNNAAQTIRDPTTVRTPRPHAPSEEGSQPGAEEGDSAPSQSLAALDLAVFSLRSFELVNRKGRSKKNRPLFPPTGWIEDVDSQTSRPDRYGRVADTRKMNTWTTPFGQVDPMEALEVLKANAWAPFVLCQALLPRLKLSARPHIVNIHAREGSFSFHKNTQHTHTNMAKAALAMLTRCLAGRGHTHSPEELEYWVQRVPWGERYRESSDRVYSIPPGRRAKVIRRNNLGDVRVAGVDPGWFSLDEYTIESRHQRRLLMPPVDEIDAASRVVMPIFEDTPSMMTTFKHYVPLARF